MKKFLAFMIVMVCAVASSYALPPTANQVNTYKGTLVKYMTEEGYRPTLDSDGDIKFKKDGYTYYISVSSYDNGYYVNIFRLLNGDGVSKSSILNAMNEAMRAYKYVRCYYMPNSDKLCVEYSWLCFNLTDFKVMFENTLTVIDCAIDKVKDNV